METSGEITGLVSTSEGQSVSTSSIHCNQDLQFYEMWIWEMVLLKMFEWIVKSLIHKKQNNTL